MINVMIHRDLNIIIFVVYMTTVIDIPVLTYFDFISNYEFEKMFRNAFPYLRIKFLDTAKPSTNQLNTIDYLIIDGNTTVKEMINKMHVQFGKKIVAQRYTIKGWVSITKTRNWTLNIQNEEGKMLAKLMP